MSTKKYLILIALGLMLLAGLGGAFIYYYKKENQATNILTAIPTDVVAVVRVNHLDAFAGGNSDKNPFTGAVNPYVDKVIKRLEGNSKFREMLENPMLISFHPIGKNRIEPLVLLNSNEELSNRQMKELLSFAKLKVNEISYNNRTIYTCTFSNGYSLYFMHAKGITFFSPSLVLIESAARKIDVESAVSPELQNVYKLTSSTSDASIVVNIKAIAPWLKANVFLDGLNMADVASRLCSWMLIDYTHNDSEATFSGMLTVDEQSDYGKQMALVHPRELLTPSLLTENTAFCLERCFDDYRTEMKRLYPNDRDSSKCDFKRLLLTVNPERAIVQHVKSVRTDSSGFVAILYPKDAGVLLQNLKQLPCLRRIQESQIVKLALDSTNASLQKILGASFQMVKPSYIQVKDSKVVMAASESAIRMLNYECSIASLRKNASICGLWKKKVTNTGVAALYINPSSSEKFLKSIFKALALDFLSKKNIGVWRGLAFTVTSSGDNLLLSGYMGRAKMSPNTTSAYASTKPLAMCTVLQKQEGGSLLVAVKADSLVALDAGLHTKWSRRLPGKPDTIFSIAQHGRNVLSLVVDKTLTYINDKGEIISRFSFSNRIERLSDKGIGEGANLTYIVDNGRILYLINPFGKEQPKRLVKLAFMPTKIVTFTFRSQNYIALSRDSRTEILNAKGAIVRWLPFDLRNGQVIVADQKMVLFSPQRVVPLNSKLLAQSDKLSGVFKDCYGVKEGMVGDRYFILLKSSSGIKVLTKDLKVDKTMKVIGEMSRLQILGGGSRSPFLLFDSSSNVYQFNAKGELSRGFPCGIGKSEIVLDRVDGMLFAIEIKGNLIVSTQILADGTTLL